jgi:hypothetical protein
VTADEISMARVGAGNAVHVVVGVAE